METNVILERYVDDGWYEYGTYNILNESEAKALVTAIRVIGKNEDFEMRVRVV